MHHLPRFLSRSKDQSRVDSKRNPRKPRLQRCNAAKHFDFDASSSPSHSSFNNSSSPATTQSLDLDRTSFRIRCSDDDFDRICLSMGLSGPDDFSIPPEAWDAWKRSSSDILPRSRLNRFDSPNSEEIEQARVLDSAATEFNTVNEVVAELGNRTDDTVREVTFLKETARLNLYGTADGAGGLIKGVRPPVLKPPPPMKLLGIDDSSTTWDLLRDLAPEGDTCFSDQAAVASFNYNEEEVDGSIDREKVEMRIRSTETALLSASCSYTTSNDDDSCSTTTDNSPDGKFRRIIRYWQRGELIGQGSFGSVYEGIANDGFFFAVKEVSLLDHGIQGKQSVVQLEQEISLLSQFEHENIVQYYGTQKDESKLYIFLEFVTKGSLQNLYSKYHLRDSQVSAYTRQILHGLKYLHDQNVIHRDIKCSNILVDANGSVKLADFGLAKASKLNDVKSCKGTAFWMAPEVVRNEKKQGYGLPADIWSLGCTVLEMLTGQIPYSDLEWMQALCRIAEGEPPHVPDTLSRYAEDFIMQCLKVEPNDRPTAVQLLGHPFVKRPLPSASGSASPYLGRRL